MAALNPTIQLNPVTLTHDGGGMAKFSPAVEGRVWFDSYFEGASVSHLTIKCEDVADVMMELMDKGYYLAS